VQQGGFLLGEEFESQVRQDVNQYDADMGKIKINSDVIAIIAGVSAMEVPGVAGMSGGISGEIAEMLGRKNMSKGVRVEVGEREAAIDLYIIAEYGYRIPEVAWKCQEEVKKSVEELSGLEVVEVNIHIQGVNIKDENK
jgi:uncharacterized alkaline shock family protein YloU